MKTYDVQEVFEILKENKITTNIESVRRWLRNGTIEGIPPRTRKEGWRVTETKLNKFLSERLPQSFATNVAKENKNKLEHSEEKAKAREEMWYELARKYIFEDYTVIKKTDLKQAAEHRKYSEDLTKEVWNRICEEAEGKTIRIYYLLEAFKFDGKRLLLDTDFVDIKEQIVYAIFEYVRKERVRKK